MKHQKGPGASIVKKIGVDGLGNSSSLVGMGREGTGGEESLAVHLFAISGHS